MAIYQYKCPRCNYEFELRLSMSDTKPVFCLKCNTVSDKQIATGICGFNGNAEPWEYSYTHKVKPKFVKDFKGNRHKFNPNTMPKGRKGQG